VGGVLHLVRGTLLYFELARLVGVAHEHKAEQDLLLDGSEFEPEEAQADHFVFIKRVLLRRLQILSDKIK
jgi:hypothetical protein